MSNLYIYQFIFYLYLSVMAGKREKEKKTVNAICLMKK